MMGSCTPQSSRPRDCECRKGIRTKWFYDAKKKSNITRTFIYAAPNENTVAGTVRMVDVPGESAQLFVRLKKKKDDNIIMLCTVLQVLLLSSNKMKIGVQNIAQWTGSEGPAAEVGHGR